MAEKCHGGKVLTTSVSVDTCPVCEGSQHPVKITTKEGPKIINSTRLLNCPNFSSASDEEKREIFLSPKHSF